MILYILLLIPVAVLAYGLGSMSSRVIASRFVFRKNLLKLGRGNIWISNFRRIYGIPGALKLLLVEIIRDLIPIGFGALLLLVHGHSAAGAAFAGFCLVMGRLWPLFYDFRGSDATICMFIAALFMNTYTGIAAIVVFALILIWTRVLSVSTMWSAVFMLVAGLILINDSPQLMLCVVTSAAVIIRHIPAFYRFLLGKEPKLSFREDLSYKFDEKL